MNFQKFLFFSQKFPNQIIDFGSLCKEDDETKNVEDLLETLLDEGNNENGDLLETLFKEENHETEDLLETLFKEENNETEDLLETLLKEESHEINANVEEQSQVRNSF